MRIPPKQRPARPRRRKRHLIGGPNTSVGEIECASDLARLTGGTGPSATQGAEEGNGASDVGLWLDRELGRARERGKTVAGQGGEAAS